MSLVESLLTAIVRLEGDALVLHVGEKPYVVTSSSAMSAFRGPLAWGQVELSTRPLAIEAVTAMLDQLLSNEQRRVLDEMGAVENLLPATEDRPSFSVIAARGGDDIWIEVRPVRPKPIEEAPSENQTTAGPPDGQTVGEEPPLVAEQPASAAVEVPIEAPDVGDTRASAAVAIPKEARSVHETPAPSAIDVPIEVALHQETPASSGVDVPIEVALVHETPAAPAIDVPIELAVDQETAASATVDAPIEAALVDETPAPVADEEPPFEIVNEEEQALPDEAEVTELLSSAGLMESMPFESGAARAPETAASAVGADEASSAAEAEHEENVSDEPERKEPEVQLEPGRLQAVREGGAGNAEEPSPAVVVPLARTLRDATGVHAVTPAPTLDRLLKIAAARGASGLYLVARSAPVIRVEGEMQHVGDEDLLAAQDIEAFALHLAPEPSREAVSSGATPEWFCELPELGRVRCLRFEDHHGPGLIVRMLPPRAISAEQLGLSREIQALCAQPDGLVLVAGPRSSGKSTLIAAFVDLVNRTRSDHVVTIERQITFVHTPRRSFVSQREVRGEAEEIASSVRAALREDPDVLVVEDLRSPEITAAAIEAAESGRLVLAGLRAPGTVHAVQRLIEQFPPERRRQIESSLAATLRGVVAQVLLRKRGGGRVAARELLLNTPVAAALIAEGKAFQLPAAIESGRKLGSAALNDTLAGLIRDGIVDSGEAWRRAWDRDGLLTALKREGIDTSFVERLA